MENISIKTISHGLTHKQALSKIIWVSILLWKAGKERLLYTGSSVITSSICIKLYQNSASGKEIITGYFGKVNSLLVKAIIRTYLQRTL